MTDETQRTLGEYFGFGSAQWMMTPAERLAIVGLLHVLRPRRALEIGYGGGGFTEQLSRYSGEVHTVDNNARVLEAAARFQNVRPWHMSSAEAWRQFLADGRRFDFCLVDADHTSDGAYADLQMALRIADVIVMHDTTNPECRAGYERALAEAEVYANLDWIDGHIQCDGVWGGLGVVLTTFPATQPYRLTPFARVNFELIRQEWRRMQT